MSAGPGKLQRHIVATIAEHGGRWRASRLPGGRNRARALAALERRGLVRLVVDPDGIERAALAGVLVSEEFSMLQRGATVPTCNADGYSRNMRSTLSLRIDDGTKAAADEVAAKLARSGIEAPRAQVLRAAIKRGLAALAADAERAAGGAGLPASPRAGA